MTTPFAPPPQDPDASTWPIPVAATTPGRRKGPLIVLVVAAGLVLMAAGAALAVAATDRQPGPPAAVAATTPAAAATTDSGIAVQGVLKLVDSSGVLNIDNSACSGMGGYSDIQAGAQVVVTDEKGTVLGTGSLDAGVLIDSGLTRKCDFSFTVLGIPRGHGFYGLSVTHRGTVQFTEFQLNDLPTLTLGQ